MRQTGKYAIQLYSGLIAVGDPELGELGADKPLRMVVLGQTKAGQSSLINALFGDVRAAIDVLPCTDMIIPYVLQREGRPKDIVFDTIGFAGKEDEAARKKLDTELEKCDLVLVVCSANTAARAPDQKLLDQSRIHFAEQTRRATAHCGAIVHRSGTTDKRVESTLRFCQGRIGEGTQRSRRGGSGGIGTASAA